MKQGAHELPSGTAFTPLDNILIISSSSSYTTAVRQQQQEELAVMMHVIIIMKNAKHVLHIPLSSHKWCCQKTKHHHYSSNLPRRRKKLSRTCRCIIEGPSVFPHVSIWDSGIICMSLQVRPLIAYQLQSLYLSFSSSLLSNGMGVLEPRAVLMTAATESKSVNVYGS